MVLRVYPKIYSYRYALSDITEVSLYRYMFSYSAIRIQINSDKELIFSFEDKQTAEAVLERLRDNCPNSIEKLREELHKYQQMWVNGWISNFDYLLFLNKLANRSF